MRILISTILSVVLFASVFGFEYYYLSDNSIAKSVNLIERRLKLQEEDFTKAVDEIKNGTYEQLIPTLNAKTFFEKPYTILFFEKDSLLYWNNNNVFCTPDSAGFIRHLSNGDYYVKKYPIDSNACLLGVFPLKIAYRLSDKFQKEESYVPSNFSIYNDAVPNIELGIRQTNFPIYNEDGGICGYASLKKNGFLSTTTQYQLAILYLLAFFSLAYLVNSLTKNLLLSRFSHFGIAFFILAVLGIKYLTTLLNMSTMMNSISLFKEYLTSDSMMNRTPASMFINIMLILWVIVFYYKNAPPINPQKMSFVKRLGLTIVLYSAILLGILMTIETHKGITSSTSLAFDFEHLFYIEITSVLSVFCLLLIWFALFLFNYKAIGNIYKLGFNRYQRTLIYIVLLFPLSYLLHTTNALEIDALQVVTFCIIYISLLDAFYQYNEGTQLSWFLFWIGIFAMSSTILLYHYKRQSDLDFLKNVVYVLANDIDKIADDEIKVLQKDLLQKRYTDRQSLLDDVNEKYKTKEYLSDHYYFTLTTEPIVADTSVVQNVMSGKDSVYSFSIPLPIYVEEGKIFYRLELLPKAKPSSDIYRSSLFTLPYLKFRQYSRLNYAIYKGKKLDALYPNSASIEEPQEIPPVDTVFQKSDSEKSIVVYNAGNDKLIIGKIEYGGIMKAIFLFTYLFIFIFTIAFFAITLNTYTHIIDDFFVLPRDRTFQTRIHLYLILLIGFSIVFILGVTVLYTNQTTDRDFTSQFKQKAEIIHKNIINTLENRDSIDLRALAASISNIHQIDIDVYDKSGKIANPEDKNIFQKGILSQWINPEVLSFLKYKDREQYNLREEVSGFSYNVSYGKIIHKNSLIGFYGIPFYQQEFERKVHVSENTSTLLSIYTLLLISFIVFTYLIGDRLYSPIREIGEKLKMVKLGQKNLEVSWKAKDILSNLVNEFNIMLSKLEQEAQDEKLIAKDEAWRSMARQVAHDIRTPLTPMKLSIQYLEHSIQDAEPNVKEVVKRIANTVIEQIDTLNGIAIDFADYSKTNAEQRDMFETSLNDFIRTKCELFLNDMDSNVQVSLHIPEKEDIIVKIDRTQMSRVLTNLITNAKQAIPDNREGRVDVYLHKRDDQAVIRISDNGSGIPTEQMEQIFQPNFTTKSSGSGLGLAICRRLIEQMDGKIYCSSTVHQGSDFFVELPIIEVNPIEIEETE